MGTDQDDLDLVALYAGDRSHRRFQAMRLWLLCVPTFWALTTLTNASVAAQRVALASAEAIVEDLQTSHIEGNVPPKKDFDRLLQRDLAAYFLATRHADSSVQFEMLRDGPTQSGVAYPKFYVWVRVFERQAVVREGAARVAAIERKRFEVTHFVDRVDIRRDPAQLGMIFPAAIIPTIESKAASPH